MNVFDVISLLGGLAMFLYGMRLMGDSLKENSSGAFQRAMERVTNSHFKAFILGVLVTALIQSSTATIVITAGLVGAGILTAPYGCGFSSLPPLRPSRSCWAWCSLWATL